MGVLFSGLWSRLFGTHKEYKIVIVGLDNAGKTTTLFQLYCLSPSSRYLPFFDSFYSLNVDILAKL
jgi:hypothetical protein